MSIFLGRAESWVDARRAQAPADFNCVPAAGSVDPETGEVTGEIVRLMAPNTPEIYRAFRSGKLEAAGIKLDPAGRPPKLEPDQKKLLTTLPDDWLNAIGVETSELQAAGWSAPPCARTVSYRRPLHALRTTAPKVLRKAAIARRNTTIASSATWVSRTPFIPPRILKAEGKDSLEGQVRAELRRRGLPDLATAPMVALPSGEDEARRQARRFRHFARTWREGGMPGPPPGLFHLTLTLQSPLAGPLCLGWGCHFGLGSFAPGGC